MTFHISNIHKDTTQAAIGGLFAAYAVISVCHIRYISNVDTRIATGYVYVDVAEPVIAADVVKALNGAVLNGNTIEVKVAG